KVLELETLEALKRRIDEAAKMVPLEQLAISPQCGFASDVVGNLISADDQKRKLERVVETARQVWGSTLSSSAYCDCDRSAFRRACGGCALTHTARLTKP